MDAKLNGYLEFQQVGVPSAGGLNTIRLFTSQRIIGDANDKHFPILSARISGENGTGTQIDRMSPLSTVEWLNVKDFGAVGDGITNDSMAFKKAILEAYRKNISSDIANNSRANYLIYIPRGYYKIDCQLTLPRSVAMMGDGPSSVRLGFLGLSDNATAIVWGGGSADSIPSEKVMVGGFTLSGKGKSYGQTGISCGTFGYGGGMLVLTNLTNVLIENFDKGINLIDNMWVNNFSNMWIRNCTFGVYHYSTVDENDFGENISFESVAFDANDIHFKLLPHNGGGVDFSFIGCSFDKSTASSTWPEAQIGGAGQVSFINCHWETRSDRTGSSGNALLLDIQSGMEHLTFSNTHFVFATTPSGTPIQWNGIGSSPVMNLSFYDCKIQGASSGPFYGAGAGSSNQPPALAVGCNNFTSTTGKCFKIDRNGYTLGAGGKIGIGTDSPQSAFMIKETGTASTDGLYIERPGEPKGLAMYMTTDNNDAFKFVYSNNTNLQERISINRDGEIKLSGTIIINTSETSSASTHYFACIDGNGKIYKSATSCN